MKLSQLKKIIKESIREINIERQPLNEEKNFFDCQTNWIMSNGPDIMAANQLEDGSYDLTSAFRTMMSGSIKACKHLLKLSNQQVMTKN